MAKRTDALTVHTPHDSQLTKDDINTLTVAGIIPADTPEPVIKMFARYCATSGLSPFKKQVHLIVRNSNQGPRFTIQTAIDGYRSIADRSGHYAGNDDAKFDQGLTQFECISAGIKQPTTATVSVYKLVGGQRCPFTATATWDAYCPPEKQAFMWNKMPFTMLAKCAEALALRKAFPDELGGVYTDEEMMQADTVVSVEHPDARHDAHVQTGDDQEREPGRPDPKKKVDAGNGVGFTGFDPSTEVCTFGKQHSGEVWSKLPIDYLIWMAGKMSKADKKIKEKVEATIKYKNAIKSQEGEIDPFEGALDKNRSKKPAASTPTGRVALEKSLKFAIDTGDLEVVRKWWDERGSEVQLLPLSEQTGLRLAWIAAKKELREKVAGVR